MSILILYGKSWTVVELKTSYSKEHVEFLKKQKNKAFTIIFCQILTFVALIIAWEVSAKMGLIDSFIMSSPLRIMKTILGLYSQNQLWGNIGVTVLETVVGFLLSTILGLMIAIIIWWSDFIAKVSEPYLVVLNALPKVALGPIIIVWIGGGTGAIILTALLVSVTISIMTILSGFKNTDEDKILLMKSFGASKLQVLTKLMLPANIPSILSALKINVGMSLIGVITGEFLVAKQGIGYLIVYGGQVFKLDLVMAGIFILGALASVMYIIISKLKINKN